MTIEERLNRIEHLSAARGKELDGRIEKLVSAIGEIDQRNAGREMTIQQLMDRVAGDDLQWAELESAMLREMANDEVKMATLAGIDKDGKVFMFRLPVEKLRRKNDKT